MHLLASRARRNNRIGLNGDVKHSGSHLGRSDRSDKGLPTSQAPPERPS